jgi:hypothetical protein
MITSILPILIFILALATAFLMGCVLGNFLGQRKGKKLENERCRNILLRALQVRGSPSTQQALVCIAGNQNIAQMITFLEDCNTYTEQRIQEEKEKAK